MSQEPRQPRFSVQDRVERIDAVCDRFEAAWRRGEQPRIEEYAQELSTEDDSSVALLELSLLEVALRRERGEPSTISDLLLQAPELSLVLQELVETRFDPEVPGLPGPSGDPRERHPESAIATQHMDADPTCSALTGPDVVERDDRTTPNQAASNGNRPARAKPIPAGTVFGRFVLLEKIGEGGMGVVYKAYQPEADRQIAIKMIKSGVLADENHLRHFQSEVELIAALDHAGIVPLYDTGEHAGMRYFTMKYVEGQTLRKHQKQLQGQSREVARIVRDVARAVHHAHQRGVLHRDLKPSNVLLDTQGNPHVIDFGLAKRLDRSGELSQLSGIAGTPGYLAPEQIRVDTQSVSTATDVYGLGTILYFLLGGHPPFEHTSIPTMFRLILEEEPPKLLHLRDGIDRDLEVICLKCLQKEPRQRYGSAEALAEDLDRWLDGRPIEARPATPVEKVVKWAKRRPAIAALAASLVVALIGGGAGIVSNWRAAVRARNAFRSAMVLAQAHEQKALEEEDEARHQAYVARLLLASREADQGNLERVQALLQETLPRADKRDLRGWEWYYLNRSSKRERFLLEGHNDEIYAIAFLPQSQQFVSGGMDHQIKLWDAQSGRLLHTLKHNATPLVLVSMPDGKRILSGGTDRRLALWDLATAQPIRQFEQVPALITDASVTPDGTLAVASCMDGTLRFFSTETGKLERTLPVIENDSLMAVAISPDGKRLAAAGSSVHAWLWDLQQLEAAPRVLPGSCDLANDLDFSPDGTRLLVGYDDGKAIVFNTASGEVVHHIEAHDTTIANTAYSPRGDWFATAGMDHFVKIWDAGSGKLRNVIRPHSQRIRAMEASPDGKSLVTSADNLLKVWDPFVEQGAARLAGHTNMPRRVLFGRNSDWHASAGWDGNIRIWESATGILSREIATEHGRVEELALSPDQTRLASCGEDGKVKIWKAATGELAFELAGHGCKVLALEFHPDGRRLVSGDEEGRILVWDLETKEVIRTLDGHTRRIYDLTFSPGGDRLVSCSEDKQLHIWNFERSKILYTFKDDPTGYLCARFSPDGSRLAISGWKGFIQLIDPATGALESTLQGHSGSVWGLAFSPDGRRLVSVSADESMRVWDLTLDAEVMQLTTPGDDARTVAFSPDGRTIATGCRSNVIRIYRSGDPD